MGPEPGQVAGESPEPGAPTGRGASATQGAAVRRRLRVSAFSSAADEKRARRPTDVLLLLVSVLGLVVLDLAAPGPTPVDESVTSLLADLPGVAGSIWRACFALLTLWAVFLIGAAAVRPGRRRLVADYLLAIALTLALAFLASFAAGTSLSDALDSLTTPSAPPIYLGTRIALCTAVVVTASPHLTHWLRIVGRGILVVGGLAGIALGVALPIGVTAGFLAGLAGAALAHLIVGSPGGRPTRQAVAGGLADLGLSVDRVTDSVLTIGGSARFRAEGPSGALWVKAYGRDAWDGQFLTSTWNALFLRGETPDLSAGRLPRAEHEALACVMAERAGVPVLPVVAVGDTTDDDVLVVTRAPAGRVLDGVVTDEQLAAAWSALGRLHAAGMAHGAIGSTTVVLGDGGQVVLADFAEATIAATQRDQRVDQCRLLVASALAAGPRRAVSAALAGLGPDELAGVLPYLQPAALDSATRRELRDREWRLKDLLTAASEALDLEPPARERIARTSVGGVLKLVFLGLFGYWIVGFVSGVDWSQVADALGSADPTFLIAALALSPVVQVFLALSTMGATLVALRYLPVLMLQYGIQFIGLVVPSSAARVALEVRFFTGWGMAAAPAMTVGMVDSFMGFLVQALLIVVILLSGLVVLAPADGATSTTAAAPSTDSSDPSLLALLAGLLLVAVIATLLFPKLRRQVLGVLPRAREVLRTQLVEARSTLGVLRRPGKIALMLGGNLAAQATQAVILGLCLGAFGQSVSLAGLVLVNTFVSLFAGFMPVPGGMGVAEAGYTAGLQALGVPPDIAVSTAVMFRMVTFYLPPIWGSVATRWLRAREYV